ncbi:MAG: hypothetical protein KBD01_08465 [Acidobacteria bacterium]|nr:hypothetical protein [Acidobacteriota bacterium]
MAARPVPPEVFTVFDRLASRPESLQFFQQGQLECVAIVFGVHPSVVETARGVLATAEGKSALEEHCRATREHDPPDEAWYGPAARRGPRSADELIDEAGRHPLGLRVLVDAPPETAAVLFDVNPFVVFHAREILHERGIDPEPEDEH